MIGPTALTHTDTHARTYTPDPDEPLRDNNKKTTTHFCFLKLILLLFHIRIRRHYMIRPNEFRFTAWSLSSVSAQFAQRDSRLAAACVYSGSQVKHIMQNVHSPRFCREAVESFSVVLLRYLYFTCLFPFKLLYTPFTTFLFI